MSCKHVLRWMQSEINSPVNVAFVFIGIEWNNCCRRAKIRTACTRKRFVKTEDEFLFVMSGATVNLCLVALAMHRRKRNRKHRINSYLRAKTYLLRDLLKFVKFDTKMLLKWHKIKTQFRFFRLYIFTKSKVSKDSLVVKNCFEND